jgi:hypothetical protein
MIYFNLIPTIKYKFSSGEYTVADIFTRVGLNKNFFKNTELYYEEISDTVLTPDRLSFEKYGTFDYYWLLMLANNVYDVNTDWPTSQAGFGEELDKFSSKLVYYIYENADIIPNDILYFDEKSYGVIESWNPFYKELVIKENYSLPTTDLSSRTFTIKRIYSDGTTTDLNTYCSTTTEPTQEFHCFGFKPYLQAPSAIYGSLNNMLNPFLTVTSQTVSESEIQIDTCTDDDKTNFDTTLIYNIVNDQTVNDVRVYRNEQRLLDEYGEKIKLNIINSTVAPLLEDKAKMMFSDPTVTANTIFRTG